MSAVALGDNGHFDAGIGDWVPWTGASVPVSVDHDASFFRSGAGAMRVTRDAGDAGGMSAMAATTPWPPDFVPPYPGGTVVVVPLTEAGTATASVWYYTAAASVLTAWLEVSFFDAGGSSVAVADVFDFAVTHGAWTEVSGSIDVPAGVTQAVLVAAGLRGTPDVPTDVPPDVGAVIWWDDFSLDVPAAPVATAGWVVG